MSREVGNIREAKTMVIGTTAYPRILDFKRFSEIAKKAGALVLADISHIAGLVVAEFTPARWVMPM